MTILNRLVDERFLAYRQRSTSLAGMAGALMAGGLFFYRFFAQGRFSWDLFAVIAALGAAKLACMVWFYATK